MKVLPVLAAVFRRRTRAVGSSWQMDETYIKVICQCKYLYRAVDKSGDTVDFLVTAERDRAAARRFLARAIDLHNVLAACRTQQFEKNRLVPILLNK